MASKTADIRWGVSGDVKTSLIPSLDRSGFLGYDSEDRISIYILATALATKLQLPPTPGPFQGLVMMKSVAEDDLAQLLLMYLAANAKNSLESVVDNVGESRRKDVVQFVNQLANSGFKIVKELSAKPEEIVIADMFDEMNREYAEYSKRHPEYHLPPYHDFH